VRDIRRLDILSAKKSTDYSISLYLYVKQKESALCRPYGRAEETQLSTLI